MISRFGDQALDELSYIVTADKDFQKDGGKTLAEESYSRNEEVISNGEDLGIGVQHDVNAKEEGERTSPLTGAIRYIGVTILLFSAFCYLRQGWENAESLWRYYSFLIFNIVLAGSGLACGLGLRETKGARTLLGVSISFMPAHFAQLGGLLYGALFGAAASVPLYLRFETNLNMALLTLITATVVLLPLAFAAFSSLARKKALTLTSIFGAVNLLLIIPTRNPMLVLGLATVAIVILAVVDALYLYRDVALQTLEGKLCRFMLYSPMFILILRNILLYHADWILLSCLCAIIAVGLFTFPKSLDIRPVWVSIWELNSVPFAVVSWLFALGAFWWPQGYLASVGAYGRITADAANILIVLIPISLILFAMGNFSADLKKIFHDLATLCAICGTLCAYFDSHGLFAAVACLAVGVVIAYRGVVLGSRLAFYGGVICVSMGILHVIANLWTVLNIAPWMAVAFVGLLTVVLSSFIESHFSQVIAGGKRVLARVNRVEL